ncbi:MAG: CAAX amino terminal protease family protein [candidate division CPR2 bacterium GW2011_GWC1_41_48]|uniref:CAAX amino terminal protease family protein n=1 Tax=candidate division CPR2 bacterium GW2011_GWC1_41_48 TaxID=1618344 RepID=A0A0G0Z8R8_UNCC2|nr:MAG: CAAX amino terminal protease family protein [candidate division CPR2 bacterium GW2011_GWC2_39_35]KKR27566.1 MAG: CAAX amino terminal protease family protein [candidate division CPR2 bacterium GW2011_GWD2_39_7]KKS09448.1 MAG: CAAX amino terminal protease family protein [candidate division CPR2 bacterium GW2011_GWC1_41_48]OGB71516.1 MAG: hypothetical protein A2Y26_01595 [candidate division CPR2 bacterium GWD2_39_7]
MKSKSRRYEIIREIAVTTLWSILAGILGLFVVMLIGLLVFKTKRLPPESTFVFFVTVWLVVYLRLKKSGKTFADIGLGEKGLFSRSTIGLLIGAGFMTATFAFLLSIKAVTFTEHTISSSLAIILVSGLAYSMIQASVEEVLFRGYFLNILAWKNRLSAILVTSALFSFLHFWHGVHLIGWLNIFLFGVFAAQSFYLFKSLWVPIGFHIGWNYFQKYVFTFPIYGSDNTRGLLALNDANKGLLSGGSFGPEGSIIITLLLVMTIGLIYWRQKETLIAVNPRLAQN